PEPRTTKKTLSVLTTHFSYLGKSQGKQSDSSGAGVEDFAGEYQTIMEQEFLDFVLFEIPWID
ncbi:Vacuolar ATP synthase subunit C, partial [Tulasnella sp. 418]